MKKLISSTVIIFFFVLLLSQTVGTVNAQNSAPTPTAIVASPTPTNTPKASDEVIVLRAQLETMQQYDQKLLATVYWSLGTIVAVAALLIGFGWYANLRVYEKDKDVMKEEFRNFLRAELVTSSKVFEKQIDEKIEKALKDYQENIKSSLAKVQTRISSIDETITGIEYKRLKDEAKTEIKSIAFSRYVDMIELSHKLPSYLDFYYSEPLENILSLLKEGVIPDPEDVKNLNKALSKVPEGYAMDVESIRQLVRNSRLPKT
jgi:hypothetical protein